jgi:hypothetical protein
MDLGYQLFDTFSFIISYLFIASIDTMKISIQLDQYRASTEAKFLTMGKDMRATDCRKNFVSIPVTCEINNHIYDCVIESFMPSWYLTTESGYECKSLPLSEAKGPSRPGGDVSEHNKFYAKMRIAKSSSLKPHNDPNSSYSKGVRKAKQRSKRNKKKQFNRQNAFDRVQRTVNRSNPVSFLEPREYDFDRYKKFKKCTMPKTESGVDITAAFVPFIGAYFDEINLIVDVIVALFSDENKHTKISIISAKLKHLDDNDEYFMNFLVTLLLYGLMPQTESKGNQYFDKLQRIVDKVSEDEELRKTFLYTLSDVIQCVIGVLNAKYTTSCIHLILEMFRRHDKTGSLNAFIPAFNFWSNIYHKYMKTGPVPETEGRFADMANFVDSIGHSDFCGLISLAWSAIVHLKMLPNDLIESYGRFFTITTFASDAIAIQYFVKSCLFILDLVEDLLDPENQHVTLYTLLFGDKEIAAAIEKADDLIAMDRFVSDNHLRSGFISKKKYAIMISEHLSHMESIQCRVRKQKQKIFKAKMLDLKDRMNSISAELNAGERFVPLFIVVSGLPGIGKSKIIKMVSQLYCKKLGVKFSDSLIFAKVKGSQYNDTLTPDKIIFKYSELFAKAPNIVKTQGDEIFEEITSIVDSLKVPMNVAAAEDKGKVFASPLLVIGDTNQIDIHHYLKQAFVSPAAYLRRMIIITPSVKPEYRVDGCCELDSRKVGLGFNPDIWRFEYTTHTAVGNINTEKHTEFFQDWNDFSNHLGCVFDHHIKKQGAVMSTFDSFIDKHNEDIKEDFVHPIDKGIKELLRSAEMETESGILENSIYIAVFATFLGLSINIKEIFKLLVYIRITQKLRSIVGNAQATIEGSYSNLKSSLSKKYLKAKKYLKDFVPTNSFDMKFDSSRFCLSDENQYSKAAAGCAVVASVIVLFMYLTRIRRTTEGSVLSVEQDISAASSYPRVKTKEHEIWNRIHNDYSPAHKGHYNNSPLCLKNARRRVRITGLRDGRPGLTQLLGVKGNYFLIHKHALGEHINEVTLHVYQSLAATTPYIEIPMIHAEYLELYDDVLLVKSSLLRFSDYTKHFLPQDTLLPVNPDVIISEYQTRIVNVAHNVPVNDKFRSRIVYDTMAMYPWPEHAAGRCGEPLIIHIGNGQAIYGIHTAGSAGMGHAIPIYKDHLDKSMDDFKSYFGNTVSESFTFPVELEVDVGPKSPFKFENFDTLRLAGKVPGFVMANQKSRLKRTIFSDKLPDIFKENFGKMPDIRYFPPLMRPVVNSQGYLSPYNVGLRKLNRTKKALNPVTLKKSIDIIVSHLKNKLKDVPQLSPLTVDSVINGVKDDEFISSLRVTTSPGFGWKGKKSDHLPLVDPDDPQSGRYLSEELNDKIVEYIDMLYEGRTTNTVYAAKLKDEPLPLEKVRAGKTRIFYPQPIESLIVGKMLLLPFYTLMIEYSLDFGAALGINAHQTWDSVMKEMIEFSPLILEGDFSSYDMSIPVDIKMAAVEIIIQFLEHKGYNESALHLCRSYMTDNLHIFVELLGDVFQVTGLQPSGKDATAEDNSLCNLLLWVYFSVTMSPKTDFFSIAKPLTYGDDVLISVKKKVSSWFNGKNFQKFCADHYNMKFTTAAKTEEMSDFISLFDSSFLKRSVVWSREYNRYIAPLKINSMYKMLEWRIPSPFVTDEEQYISMCTSFMWECFFHLDEAKHNKVRVTLEEVIVENFIGSIPNLPTYGEIRTKLGWDQKLSFSGHSESGYCDQGHSVRMVSRKPPKSKIPTCPRSSVRNGTVIRNSSSNDFKEEIHMDSQYDAECLMTSGNFIKMNKNAAFASIPSGLRHRNNIKRRIEEQQMKLNVKRRPPKTYMNIVTESGNDHEMHSGDITAEKKEVVENFKDHAGLESNVQYTGLSRYSNFGQVEKHGIEKFLMRPIEITTFSIPVASPADTSVQLKVWDTITLEPSIRAKLKNFAYLHTDLEVTINISGTPFHSGKIMISYQPYPLRNDPLQALLTRMAVDAVAYRPLLLNYLSQSPGTIVMDVKENKPVKMVIPFISHKPMFRLYNDSAVALTDVTSYEDIEEAGSLFIYSINQAASVSSTPSDISVMVYGRMINPSLGTLTATVTQITTESGYDEEKQGPIQKWSSAIAEYAGYLNYIPPLKPFATPIEMISGGVGKFASIFGWSKPILTENISLIKRIPMANGSLGIGNETAFKLSLDPKQALTVDGAYAGNGQDELVINYISQRESYLTTFDWLDTDSVLSTPIFKCAVTPDLYSWYNVLTRSYYQPSALAMTALPFTYWNGTIVFRIEVVCSAYHRGKLAVVYEPNISQHSLISADVEQNKQYMVVIDLQDTQSVDLCISWASSRPWLKTRPVDGNGVAYRDAYGTSAALEKFSGFANGFIRVVPFTKLQSPDSSDVKVNVYVKSSDIKYAGPNSVGIPFDRTSLNTESGEDHTSMGVTCVDVNESSIESKTMHLDYFGESYPTFRTLLKRYQAYPKVTQTVNDNFLQYLAGVMPLANPAWGSSGASRSVPLFEYLRFAYVAIKGSVRARFKFDGNLYYNGSVSAPEIMNSVVVQLDDPSSTLQADSANMTSGDYYMGLTPGVQFTNTSANGVEVDLPFMSNNLYHYAFASDYNGASINDSEFESTWYKNFRLRVKTFGTSSVKITRLMGTGEDFNLVRFQGAPPFTVSQA